MFVRYDKENYHELFEDNEPFILMVYFMKQGEFDENTQIFYDHLALYPSYVKKHDELKGIDIPNQLVMFENQYPDIKIVEAYHHEVYDLVMDCGIDYDTLWKDFDKIFQPLILSFKNKNEYETSYSKCYCVETLTELSIYIRPDLFIPTSVSES